MAEGLIDIPPDVGLPVMGLLVGGESLGIPLPGETALIAAAVLAREGKLSIASVLLVAAAAAIVGDNIGYVIGRFGGRRLLTAPGPLERHRRALLQRAEPFFQRHGAKAVFLGRWFSGLRVVSAWMAGITRLRWPVFVFWNAAGGIAWVCSVGLLAYALGHVVVSAFSYLGIGGVIVAAAAVALFLGVRWWRARPARGDLR